jgi:tetratricopeptide (TPR) repeat protein
LLLWPAAALVALLAAGCVPPEMGQPPSTRAPVPSTAPTAPPPPAVAVIRPVPDIETAPPAPAEPLPAPRTAPPVSSASQALLTQSRGHQAAGRYEEAAASIERALRIEPRQPVLWLELGNIRLKEGDFAQAESMGRKALSLATGDAALTARAEQLIATAKRR